MTAIAKAAPKVSVLMSVYNGELHLREAIESIFSQTFGNFEFVIINDGSTDTSQELIDSFSDSRLVVIKQENMGVTKSLNKGLKIARGEYIARQDADDISLSDRLEKQVAYMDAHSEIAVLGGAAIAISNSGQVCGCMQRPESHEELVSRIYKENPFIHPTVMYRREFIEALGGYAEDFLRAQDYDLWLRGYRFWQFHNLQEPLIRYRLSRIRMRNAFYSSRAILRAIRRDGVLISHGWYVLRPILATLLLANK